MPKKNIYFINILAIISFLIIVAVFLFLNYIDRDNSITPSQTGINHSALVLEKKKPNQKSVASSTDNVSLALASPLDFAKKSGQAEDCLKSANESYKKTCLMLLAQYLQSSTTCLSLKSQDDQVKCADQAIYEKATKNNRISFCFNIKSDELILSCVQSIISKIGASKGDCNALPDKERKYCLDFLAYSSDQAALKSAKNNADCQKISDKFLNDVCLGKFPNN